MSLKNWSTTAASNNSAPPNGAPENTTLLADLNDIIRQNMADTRTLAASDTIASAATCDLGSKDATFLTVSGVTTVTSFGTVSAGIWKYVIFSGALTLTHNATSLILFGANITTVAGDSALMLSLGSGNWRCLAYQPVGGYARLAGSTAQAFSASTLTAATAGSSIAIEALTAPTMTNSWVNFSSTIGYWKDAYGVVHLEGTATTGTIGTSMFTLPVGYRPSAFNKSFAVDSNGAYGNVEVNTTGTVTAVVGTSSSVDLDGISFRTT